MPNAAGEGEFRLVGRSIKGDVKRTKESFSPRVLVLREFPQKEKPALECQQPREEEGKEREREGDKVGLYTQPKNRIGTEKAADLASGVTSIWAHSPLCRPVLTLGAARWHSQAHVA